MNILILTILIGIGATVVMDVWTMLRKQLFGIALPNYSLVGRWVAYMPKGKFRHESIAKVPSIQFEALIGWLTHFLTGIAFAGLLVLIGGSQWIAHPTVSEPILVGIITVLAPFLLMQPAMGAGIAASKTPNPRSARTQSLITHTVFGVGLYLSGYLLSLISA